MKSSSQSPLETSQNSLSEDPQEVEGTHRRTQYAAAAIATIGSFGFGTVLTWTAPALPNIEESQDLGEITSSQKTWIASLAVLGSLFSGPICGFLISRFGRKRTMQNLALPFLLGWAFIGFAKFFPIEMTLPAIYIGRFITGFAGGCFTVAVPVYISEIVEARIRGILGSAMILSLVIGVETTFILGKFLSWNSLALACGFIPILHFFLLFFIPESPRYLLTKNEYVKASESLKKLRKANFKTIESELKSIQEEIGSVSGDSLTSKEKVVRLFTAPVLKPLAICLTLMALQQFSGTNGVTFYTVDILKSTGTDLDSNVGSMIIGAVQVGMVFVTMVLIEKVGRVWLLIVSNLIMFVSLISLSVFFHFKSNLAEGQNLDGFGYLPLLSLVGWVIGYNIGMGPIAWLLMGELLPPYARGLASAIVASFYSIVSFTATKTFDDFTTLLGWTGVNAFFGVVCLLAGIFAYFFIPETKQKSSEEIQRYFSKDNLHKISPNPV